METIKIPLFSYYGQRKLLADRVWRVKVTGGYATGDNTDEALQAVIEKSKKLLAKQRHLLQQIAERREIITSINNATIDSEIEELSSEDEEGSFLESDSNLRNNPSNSSDDPPEYRLPDNFFVSFSKNNYGDASKSDINMLPKSIQEISLDRTTRNELPPFVSDISTTYKMSVDTNESMLHHITNVADVSIGEDVKSTPLAGPNVMNIILVAAECAPWSKTGGLGDAVGALPKALANRGHRVMVVPPQYGNYAELQDTGISKWYKVNGQDMEAHYFQTYINGVHFVFIANPIFHNLGSNIYGGNRIDILRRMVLFCKAAIETPWHVRCGGTCYGDGNLVFIANDWHTALLPVYLKAYYHENGLMEYARSVLVIHNIAHQGRGPLDDFYYVDLPPHYMNLFKLYDPLGGEHFNIFAAVCLARIGIGYLCVTHSVGDEVFLKSILNPSEIVARGWVKSLDPNVLVGDKEIGHGWCEVNAQVPIKKR